MATLDTKYTTSKTIKDIIKLENQRANFMVKCQNCGHTMPITDAERTICSHCGKWVYKNKQIEFKYKLKEKMIQEIKNDVRMGKK